ncbi:hypothetical protein AVEN_149045-1 [Araneus ventricosus]|uniref:DUF4219 domain-containing protein n=1 Tax=Araneus ventricosus TaxID=182803 RepID=A0A4Y2AFE9_ARAVE|nr:hypothetical protein AVEN_149045-1 [Araneus ventricosus]
MNDKVAPLTSDNYPSWKQDMIAILLDRNVYDIVLGKENPPGDDATEKEKMLFKKRCNKAFSSIYLNVSKDLRPLIADITEGKKAWEEVTYCLSEQNVSSCTIYNPRFGSHSSVICPAIKRFWLPFFFTQ